jgi:glucose-6-phosphate dehydrogenase assembly protein OpcA
MTTSIVSLENIGKVVPLGGVEKEINQQLRAARGDKEDVPTQRVCMSNLVIYCQGAEAGAKMSAAVLDIVAAHPARVLLLVGEPDQPGDEITSAVLVQCRMLGKHQQACTEQVLLRARGNGVQRLPFAVRSLMIGDLPTNVWWAAQTPPPLAGELLFDLSENAQQIIYDSIGWTDPPRGVMATASWLEGVERTTAGRWRVASDLNWRRLKYWRRILSEAMGEASAPGAAESVTRLVLEHGPHAVVQGYLLVSWISQRLGWTLKGGKASGGTETTWRFSGPRNEVIVVLKRLPEGEATLRHVRINCTLDAKPVTMNLIPEDGQRLSITLEGLDAAPRTVTTPPQPYAELIGKQLSDRERDPVFRQSMTVAGQLARNLLG